MNFRESKGIVNMKGREIKGAPSTADLLVCFPSRAHLTLMPKSICSPARGAEPNNNHHRRNPSAGAVAQNYQNRLKKKRSVGRGRGSPMLWGKTKQEMGSGDIVSEPTSPKVTCAGQIKVRHHRKSASAANCKSWQSVMEEIERIHNHRKQQQQQSKRSGGGSSWAESLGFKKEVMHFLTCLRSLRFDLRCFGSFPQTDVNSDDDEDEEEEDDDEDEEDDEEEVIDGNEEAAAGASKTVFSKWFMALQEDNNGGSCEDGWEKEKEKEEEPAVPPANALLLMRCRSAPAKSWMEQKQEEEEAKEQKKEAEEEEEEEEEEEGGKEEKTEEGAEEKIRGKDLKTLMEEERKKEMEKLIVMRYDTDFYKISCDVAKETWVVGTGTMTVTTDPFARSRSWKR